MFDLPPEYYRWMAAAKTRGRVTYREMVEFLNQTGQVTPETREGFLQLVSTSGIEVVDSDPPD